MRYWIQSAVLAALLLGPVGQAQAFIAWDWTFSNDSQTFGTNDTVFMYGRLFNNSTDGETIGSSNSGSTATVAGFEAHAVPYYSFNFGPESGNIFDAFDTPIAPGESRDFVFGRQIPVGAPEGGYTQATGIDLWTGFQEDGPVVSRIDRDFTWTVADPQQPVVPEPASMSLLAFGLGGLALRKKR